MFSIRTSEKYLSATKPKEQKAFILLAMQAQEFCVTSENQLKHNHMKKHKILLTNM